MVVIHIPALHHLQNCLKIRTRCGIILCYIFCRQRIHPILSPLAKLNYLQVQFGANPSQNIISCAVATAVGKLARRSVIVGSHTVAHRPVRRRGHNDRNASALENSLHVVVFHHSVISSGFACGTVDSHIHSYVIAGANGQKDCLHSSIVIETNGISPCHTMIRKSAKHLRNTYQSVSCAVAP